MGEDEGLPAFECCALERLFELSFSPLSVKLKGFLFGAHAAAFFL
jgi:hypothetical protein